MIRMIWKTYVDCKNDTISECIDRWQDTNKSLLSPLVLPPQESTIIHREIMMEPLALINPKFFIHVISPRFVLKYTKCFNTMTALDIYHGHELELKIENLTGQQIENHSITWLQFMDEKNPRFAVCAVFKTRSISLCVLELDIVNGKLTIHQVFEVLSGEGLCFGELTQSSEYFFYIRLDQAEILHRRSSTHLFYAVEQDMLFRRIEFQLEYPPNSEVPIITSKKSTRQFWRMKSLTLIDQKEIFIRHSYRNFRDFEWDPSELKIINLRDYESIEQRDSPTVTKVPIKNFDLYCKYGKVDVIEVYDTTLCYFFKDGIDFKLALTDLKTFTFTGLYNFKASVFDGFCGYGVAKGISDGFCKYSIVSGNELLILCMEEYSYWSKKHKRFYNSHLLPMGRPLPLIKLAFFAIRRFSFKDPKYDLILKNVDLPHNLKPLGLFKKCQTIQDKEFQDACKSQEGTPKKWPYCSIL